MTCLHVCLLLCATGGVQCVTCLHVCLLLCATGGVQCVTCHSATLRLSAIPTESLPTSNVAGTRPYALSQELGLEKFKTFPSIFILFHVVHKLNDCGWRFLKCIIHDIVHQCIIHVQCSKIEFFVCNFYI